MGLIDSIIGAESGGNPNATNPNSSASGPGQFLNATWLDVARKVRPDLADKSDAEVLALKTDPQLARQATDYYAQQNQAILAKAGIPVTAGNTYLAHFAGPQGAVKVLQADPNASVSDILGAKVVEANPFLRGMTASGLQAWAAHKMGGAVSQGAPQNNAPANPAGPPSAPLQVPQPTLPTFAAQQSATQSPVDVMQSMPQAPPIYYAPRRSPDLSRLQAALSGGFSFPRG